MQLIPVRSAYVSFPVPCAAVPAARAAGAAAPGIRFQNPVGPGLRQIFAQFRYLHFNIVGDFAASVITGAVLALVSLLMIGLWIYGFIPGLAQWFVSLIRQTYQQALPLDPFERVPLFIVIRVYALVLLPLLIISLPFYLLALVAAAAMDAPEWSAWVWGAGLAVVVAAAFFLGPFWWISWWGLGLLTVAAAVLIVRYMLN